jgi:hypothetical protein
VIGGPMVERAALLRQAAEVLLSRMPTWTARFSREGIVYRARFEWPGIVSVCEANTGELLARSLPGQPTLPDKDTAARSDYIRMVAK